MNLLVLENVSKSYGEKILLEGVCFGIEEEEKIGLLGLNGSGKSTFLKLLAGVEEVDEGSVVKNRDLRLAYLAQDPGFAAEASVLETVLNGDPKRADIFRRYSDAMARTGHSGEDKSLNQELLHLSQAMEAVGAWNLESDARTMLNRLGIFEHDAFMSSLSGGQRKRVALAAVLINPVDLLILDEPTNHLDNQAIDWLEEFLQKFNGALLMVTHDRYFLERVTRRIIEVDKAHLYSYPGNYSQYLESKLQRQEIEASMAVKQQAILRKELAWIRRGARARSTKQKARIQRFEKLQEDSLKPKVEKLQISSAASRLGKKTIILNDVTHGYQGGTLIDHYFCILARDERMGVVGPNGIGKSTLLRIMNGEITPDHGQIETGPTVKIGYFPQESTGLPENMRVIDYIREAGEYLQAGKKMLSASQMLDTFLFSGGAQWTTLEKLSGGEKRRLHLLRILMSAPNVLLLDEPGNDLDIETLTILEDYLDDFPGAVVAVSHDRYFLDRVCESILAFEGEGKLVEYPGSYSDYRSYAAASSRPASPADSTSNLKPGTDLKESKRLKFSYNEQREYDEIDDKIALVEAQLKDMNARIDQAASDYQALERLLADRQAMEQRLEELLERWTYLNELAEEIEKQKKS